MSKKISKYMEFQEMLLMLVVLPATFIFGLLLHDFLINLDMKKSEEVITVFPLGTLIAFITMIILLCIVGATAMCHEFGMLVGMGATRREFFIRKVTSLGLNTVISMVLFVILGRIENYRLNTVWKEYPMEFDFSPFLTVKNAVIAIVVLVGVSLLVSSVIMKFGRKGFWVIWGIYMICCLSMSRMSDIMAKINPQFIESVSSGINVILTGMVIFAIIGAIISWVIVRKQEVY